jgi:hypothetical protein
MVRDNKTVIRIQWWKILYILYCSL